ncbi:MAG: S8 family serine peptidase, partial [Thermoleophilia bacterium]
MTPDANSAGAGGAAAAKLDVRLRQRLDELAAAPPDTAPAAAGARVGVFVTFTGDLAAIERAGLHTESVAGTMALGTIAAGDLERVAAVDGVISIGGSAPQEIDLHTSVPEINADDVRTGALGLDGSGVIVGVVDSGIDVFHHSFRKADGTTRILSVLDLTMGQTISLTGAPTGGTFQLRWTAPAPASGTPAPTPQTTAPIAFDAAAPAILNALEALGNIEPGHVQVTGNLAPDNRVLVEFVGPHLTKLVDLMVAVPALTGGTSPGVSIIRGREFTQEQINQNLTAPGAPFTTDTDGHGTHVAGTAAGDGSQADGCNGAGYYVGVAPGADIIAVKTTFRSADTARGIAYIFERAAAQLPQPKPAVVNLSLGGGRGARNGSADSERWLDQQLHDAAGDPIPGRAIVKSAGNDGGLYDHDHPELATSTYSGGRHAHVQLAANQANLPPLQLIVEPRDRTRDEVDIWYAGGARVQVNVTSPAPGSATLPAPVNPNGASGPFPVAGNTVRVFSTLNDAVPNRHEIVIQIDPAPAVSITPGTWLIQLSETAGAATDVDLWIAAGDGVFPRFHRTQQSRTRTLTIPATAQSVICVGAYNAADSTLAEFSSRGPTTELPVDPTPQRIKPDLCAPGVGIIAPKTGARPSDACCECCVDFYKPLDGTSMAAPHVTGIVALLFQRNRNLTFEQVRAHLMASGRSPDPITGPTLPNSDWGTGKVDALVSAAGVPPSASGEDAARSVALRRGGLRVVPGDEPIVLPAGAYMSAHLPAELRVRELQRRVGAGATGQLAAALVSTHVDEVLRLIESNRRVALAWHRMHGPVLLRLLLAAEEADGAPLLPRTLGGEPL